MVAVGRADVELNSFNVEWMLNDANTLNSKLIILPTRVKSEFYAIFCT